MVNILHPYIHKYDFPYHGYLESYEEKLINSYLLEKKQNKDTTDTLVPLNHSIDNFLTPKINKLIEKNYWTKKPLMDSGIRIYIQNNQDYVSFYHNHVSSTNSTIQAVFYLNPPKEGGKLSFLVNPDSDPSNVYAPKELLIKPKKNKLYLFPYWIYHKPLPQKDERYRICFNWSHGSMVRPIHKMTGIAW